MVEVGGEEEEERWKRGRRTVWVFAEIGGEEAAAVDAKGGDLRADALVWGTVGELGVYLRVEVTHAAEEVRGEGVEEGLLLGVFGVAF